MSNKNIKNTQTLSQDIKQLIRSASERAVELEPLYGSGYSVRQLELMRQFYGVFPIVNTVRSQLNWSQYKLLIRIDNEDKREFYIAESIKNSWSSRELERQINASLFERLLLSNDKKSVLEVARAEKIPHDAKEIIKDPMVLHKLTHQDVGQLQMYVNYYERVEKERFENPTIGVLLCADKNDTVAFTSLRLCRRSMTSCLPLQTHYIIHIF